MTGLPEYNYPAFRAAEKALREAGYGVLNPVDAEDLNPTPGRPQEWHWYMRHALRMVLASDGIALLPGWENSRGATLEVQVAKALTLPLADVSEWLERAA
jgi:hypothetical protein